MTKRTETCEACGHKGGRLAVTEGLPVPVGLAASKAGIRLPPMLACSGRTFEPDGAVECLRRMMARRA